MENPFNAILVLLTFSVVIVALFRRLHFPSLLGYLCVGIVVGPHVLELAQHTEQIQKIAEYGVVFLLFTVGLEFSLPQLFAMKTTVLGLGGAQVVLTGLVGALIAWLLGSDITHAFLIGSIVALSSTAIVLKQLNEQLEMHSRHARTAVGILIFQDLAVIPILILLPLLSLGGQASIAGPLAIAFLKGIGVFVLMLAIGRWLLRPLFREIAQARSTELFMLTVLLVTLAAAWSTHLVELSPALGAFIAGVMLGETEFRHQIEANIKPFRDILLGLFFITIGMLLNLKVVYEYWHWILLAVFALIVIKTAIVTLLGILFRLESGVALRSGLVLAQGGEFGFAIISLALSRELMNPDTAQIILAITVISMIIAPFLIRINGPIVKFLLKRSYVTRRKEYYAQIKQRAATLQDHVIICGYGRVGQNIARFLDIESIPYIALEVDPHVVEEASKAGDCVYFGDSTHADILRLANLHTARIVVIGFEGGSAGFKILEQVRSMRQDIPVLVRTSDDGNYEKFLDSGATEVVPEKLEASLALVTHLLLLLDFPMERIESRINRVREDRYQILRNLFHDEEPGGIEDTPEKRSKLHSLALPSKAWAIGKTLQELDLDRHNVNIVSILRSDGKITNPGKDMILCGNDVLVLHGQPEDIEHAEAIIFKG